MTGETFAVGITVNLFVQNIFVRRSAFLGLFVSLASFFPTSSPDFSMQTEVRSKAPSRHRRGGKTSCGFPWFMLEQETGSEVSICTSYIVTIFHPGHFQHICMYILQISLDMLHMTWALPGAVYLSGLRDQPFPKRGPCGELRLMELFWGKWMLWWVSPWIISK